MARERGVRLDLSPAEIVERALAAVTARPNGERILYGLGAGGNDPTRPHPATFGTRKGWRWRCDCSGFVAWALGADRFQPATAVRWIETTRMVVDARGDRGDLFEQVEYPELGAVVVYGDSGGRQGHCGIVVEVPAEWDVEHPQHELVRVVHCSTGNQRRTGNSIAETDATLWRRRGGVWLRYRTN